MTGGGQVCAVVTTFRPDVGLPDRVGRLRFQVGAVVVVDDSGTSANDEVLNDLAVVCPDVMVRRHPANRGIAAALNTGVQAAASLGYDWVLTLDDDTVVRPAMIERLLEAWSAIETAGPPIAIMGMSFVERGAPDSAVWPDDTRPVGWREKRGIITSGSLFRVDAYRRIGGFREEFVIDGVDYDFCLRARALGYRVIKLDAVGMAHSLGETSRCMVGPWRIETTNHSPLRRYYAARNSTVLLTEHARRDPAYAVAVAVFQVKTAMLVLLFEADRWLKLRAMLRGTADGLQRRLGKRAWQGGRVTGA